MPTLAYSSAYNTAGFQNKPGFFTEGRYEVSLFMFRVEEQHWPVEDTLLIHVNTSSCGLLWADSIKL